MGPGFPAAGLVSVAGPCPNDARHRTGRIVSSHADRDRDTVVVEDLIGVDAAPHIDGGKALIRNHGDDHRDNNCHPTQGKRHPAADMERRLRRP